MPSSTHRLQPATARSALRPSFIVNAADLGALDPDADYSAHVPDLPGCIAAAATLDETRQLMKEAIEGHLECMREFGYAVPPPTTVAEAVEVAA